MRGRSPFNQGNTFVRSLDRWIPWLGHFRSPDMNSELCNPQVWLEGARLYIELARLFPNVARTADVNELASMRRLGENLQQFYRKAVVINGHLDVQFYKTMLNNYENSVGSYLALLEKHNLEFLPLAGPDQPLPEELPAPAGSPAGSRGDFSPTADTAYETPNGSGWDVLWSRSGSNADQERLVCSEP